MAVSATCLQVLQGVPPTLDPPEPIRGAPRVQRAVRGWREGEERAVDPQGAGGPSCQAPVQVAGLAPASTFLYRVGSPQGWWAPSIQYDGQVRPAGAAHPAQRRLLEPQAPPVRRHGGSLLVAGAVFQGTENAASLPHIQRAADGGEIDAVIHVGHTMHRTLP